MKKYNDLNQIVRGQKKINIFNIFKIYKAIRNIAFDEMRKIGFTEPEYKLYFNIKDFRGYNKDLLGEEFFVDGKNIGISINAELVDALDSKHIDFKRVDLFLILFHELEHIRQSKMFETDEVDNEDLLKDKTVSEYIRLIDKTNPYYRENYKVITEEVLANIKSIEKTTEYFNNNNIELTKEELEYLKNKLDENRERLNNKNRINPLDGQAYDLDELYKYIKNERNK